MRAGGFGWGGTSIGDTQHFDPTLLSRIGYPDFLGAFFLGAVFFGGLATFGGSPLT